MAETLKKRADERRDTIYWFPPCDLIEKRIGNLCPFVGDLHPYTC